MKKTARERDRWSARAQHECFWPLTVADFLARHVVSGREAVLGDCHVSVEGEGQQARGRLDLRRDLGATVAADEWSHCRGINQTDLNRFSLFFFFSPFAVCKWCI